MVRGTVMVVDDNANHLQMIVEVLERRGGYTCLPYSDSNEAYQRAIKNDIALILADVNMPGLSGLAFARMLRNRKPEPVMIPVLLMSGEIDGSLVAASQELDLVRTYEKTESNDKLVGSTASLIRESWTANQISALHTKTDDLTGIVTQGFDNLSGAVITVDQVDTRLEAVAKAMADEDPGDLPEALQSAHDGFKKTISGLGAMHLLKVFFGSWAFRVVFWPLVLTLGGIIYAQQSTITIHEEQLKAVPKMEKKIDKIEAEYQNINTTQQIIQKDIKEIKQLLAPRGTPAQ